MKTRYKGKFIVWLYLKSHPFVYKYGSGHGPSANHVWYNLDNKEWYKLSEVERYWRINT